MNSELMRIMGCIYDEVWCPTCKKLMKDDEKKGVDMIEDRVWNVSYQLRVSAVTYREWRNHTQ